MAPLRLTLRRREVANAETRQVELSLRVPTALDVVEEAVDLVARHCVACGVPARAARVRLRVVLCEALANAILYGNQLDPDKRVQVRVSVAIGGVTMRVEDEGAGFDPAAIPDPTQDDRLERTGGRGLFLINQLSDEVRHNERGNAICMTMHLH